MKIQLVHELGFRMIRRFNLVAKDIPYFNLIKSIETKVASFWFTFQN